tara:strand:- start:5561 stop:6865 length:1305 start_codon:yes stop_codon:yes gene_type:complete
MYEFITSRDERAEEILRLTAHKETRTDTYPFRDKSLELPQIEIDPKYLAYRLSNTRTRLIQKNIIKNEGLKDDYFDSIQFTNDDAVQRKQHDILKTYFLDNQPELEEEIERRGNKQIDSILITPTGTVINGNRRLCLMRNKGFTHIKCIVLTPPKYDGEQWERAFENDADYYKTTKVPYPWHAEAFTVWEMRNVEGKSDAEIFTEKPALEGSERALEKHIIEYELAKEYLELINQQDEWNLMDNSKQVVQDAAEKILKVRKNDVNYEQQIKLYLFLILGRQNLEDENREDNMRTSAHLKLKAFTKNARLSEDILNKSGVVNKKETTSQLSGEKRISYDYNPASYSEIFGDPKKINDTFGKLEQKRKDLSEMEKIAAKSNVYIDVSEKALIAIQLAKNALDEEFSGNPNLDGVKKKFEDIEKIANQCANHERLNK